MGRKQSHGRMRVVLVVLAAAVAVAAAANWYAYLRDKRAIINEGEARMRDEAARAAGHVGERALSLMAGVDALAADMSAGRVTDDALRGRLEAIVGSDPHILEAGVAYVPFRHDPQTKLFAPHYGRKDGAALFFRLDDGYDYTAADWYARTVTEGAGWIEPCCGAVLKKLVTGYAAPFYAPGDAGSGRALAGVVRVTIPLTDLGAITGSLPLGKTGYVFIISKEGRFILHPVDELVANRVLAADFISKRAGPFREKMLGALKKALAGEKVSIELTNPLTGQASRIYYQPVPQTGWVFGTAFLTNELLPDERPFQRRQIRIVLLFIVFFTALTALLVKAHTLRTGALWAVAVTFSLLCLAGTVYLWRLEIRTPLAAEPDQVMLTDAAGLNAFSAGFDQSVSSMGGTPPLWVPTGIFIQSLEFASSNDLVVAGYVWQRYPAGIPAEVGRGFVMPEAQKLDVTEVYRVNEGGEEVVGWHFEATLRQKFDFSKYPFDRPAVNIWLKHSDFKNNVMLKPDLASYQFLSPAAHPGIESELALPGFAIMGSFFCFDHRLYATNFGIEGHRKFGAVPELIFSVVLKRNIMTPFLSRVFPLAILLAILFIVLLTFSKDEEKRRSFGLSGLTVMGVVITFLFTTLIAQSNLRQELGADRIIYLEDFYFITYFVLLLAAIKTFLFTADKNIRIVQYEQGLIAKILFWPLVTGLVFLVTLVHFY